MQLLFVSAGITVLIAVVHSYLGEKKILPRLFANAGPIIRRDPVLTRAILRWTWHLTSLAWIALALLLAAMTRVPAEARTLPVTIIAGYLALSGLICFLTTRGRHIAWPFFLAAAATAALAVSA
jgi:hypothetical protein